MNTDSETLLRQIIGCAVAVHRELGPGFLESVYEAALCVALTDAGLRFERQKTIAIHFRGRPVGEHRLDLVVENQIVIENKAIAEVLDVAFAIVRSYLKAGGHNTALILNYHAPTLVIRRVGSHWQH